MRSGRLSGRSLACLITSSLLFACVLAAVLLKASEGFDAATRTAVNGWANPNLTSFFLFVTQLGSVAVVYALTTIEALALMVLRRWRDAVYLLVVMAAAAAVNNAVKFAVARARPEAFFGDLPASYSFASGHALYSGCIYGVLGGLLAAEMSRGWQKGLILLLTLALIGVIGLSRVYLGVHYPTDVVAGFALAALILCLARTVIGPRPAQG
jgi:membrane-associated phospholipid phosphatase